MVALFDLYKMVDKAKHASDLWAIWKGIGFPDATESKRPQRATVLWFRADRRANLGDDEIAHDATSLASRRRFARSRGSPSTKLWGRFVL